MKLRPKEMLFLSKVQQAGVSDMGRALIVMLLPILLAACTGPSAPKEVEANRSDRCVYAVEGIDVGRMMKWGSCSNPPPYAISRISD